MKLGMTGSRNGISEKAQETLKTFIKNSNIIEVHHGDCIGADRQFHDIATEYKIKTVIQPPKISSMRAFCRGDIILQVKDYLERNRNIVDNTEILIAFPRCNKEELRSGTWSTIRYAHKKNKKVVIVYPDGSIRDDSIE